MKKGSFRFWMMLVLVSLVGQAAHMLQNQEINVFAWHMLDATQAEMGVVWVTSMLAMTAGAAFAGGLSDRMGRRRPVMAVSFLVWGAVVMGFCLLRRDVLNQMFGNAHGLKFTLWLVLSLAEAAARGAALTAGFSAWITDSSHRRNRGAVEGVYAVMPWIATGISLVFYADYIQTDLSRWTAVYLGCGGALIALGIAAWFLLPEAGREPSGESVWGNACGGFSRDALRDEPKLYWCIGMLGLLQCSMQCVYLYTVAYLDMVVRVPDANYFIAAFLVVGVAAALVLSRVYSRKGLRFTGLILVAVYMAGCVVLLSSREHGAVFVGYVLLMAGYLPAAAVFGAAIRDFTPEGRAGQVAGPIALALTLIPGIGSFVIRAVMYGDFYFMYYHGSNPFLPDEGIFLAALVMAAVLFVLLLKLDTRLPGRTVKLSTPWAPEGEREIPWNEYPRPMLVRKSFLCLNGPWSLRRNGKSWGTIQVPYPPESPLSGIGRGIRRGDVLTYERVFALPEGFRKDRVILHFGAVDQICTVYVNNHQVGGHEGGYLPFSLDITDALAEGANRLRVEVRDDLDHDLPWGKQSRRRGGMWYTPVSGIWQTVWLESVPEGYVRALRITTDMESAVIEIEGGTGEMYLSCDGRRYAVSGGRVTIRPEKPRLWSPEDPYLYRFTLTAGEDQVESYFALRRVEIRKIGEYPRLCLNGKPCFFHGLLDQGYYPEGIYLPGSPGGYTWDIKTMRSMGFNMLRKHIKIEPERFYYDCDRLGMVVFQDLVNSGEYYYLRDTALPTIGFRKDTWHPAPSARRREFFLRHGEDTVRHLHNHPCVCFYTLFNEGWGQHDAQALYEHFKAFAPDRIWNAASGWFKNSDSDLQSEHIYFGSLAMKAGKEKPLVLTEFGGYSWPVEGHRFNLDEEYGYQKYRSREALQTALERLYEQEIIPQVETGLCMAVLTQLSDVEDETNGLVTYDRQVVKVQPDAMRMLALKLRHAMEQGTKVSS